MNQVLPTPRCSPLEDELSRCEPLWGSHFGMRVAVRLGEDAVEQQRLSAVGVADVSALTSCIVKGPGAAELLKSRLLPSPAAVYQTVDLNPDGFVARTGAAEFMIEDGWRGDAARSLWLIRTVDGVVVAPRHEASLVVVGPKTEDLFAQTCGFPFRQLGDSLVFTRVAGVSCALRRSPRDDRRLRIWLDGTYAAYLWSELVEISEELGGGPVGVASAAGLPHASS